MLHLADTWSVTTVQSLELCKLVKEADKAAGEACHPLLQQPVAEAGVPGCVLYCHAQQCYFQLSLRPVLMRVGSPGLMTRGAVGDPHNPFQGSACALTTLQAAHST